MTALRRTTLVALATSLPVSVLTAVPAGAADVSLDLFCGVNFHESSISLAVEGVPPETTLRYEATGANGVQDEGSMQYYSFLGGVFAADLGYAISDG